MTNNIVAQNIPSVGGPRFIPFGIQQLSLIISFPFSGGLPRDPAFSPAHPCKQDAHVGVPPVSLLPPPCIPMARLKTLASIRVVPRPREMVVKWHTSEQAGGGF